MTVPEKYDAEGGLQDSNSFKQSIMNNIDTNGSLLERSIFHDKQSNAFEKHSFVDRNSAGPGYVLYDSPGVRVRRGRNEDALRRSRKILLSTAEALEQGELVPHQYSYYGEKTEIDTAILERRTNEIEKFKEKPIYARYLSIIPKRQRLSFHPKTPNKHKVYSRRSWDAQIRLWKKTVYNVCNEYDEYTNENQKVDD